MNLRTQMAYRVNARAFGVTLLIFSVASLLGTIWAYFKVSSLGTQIGVNAVQDPASWVVLVGGMFITFALAGLGTTLGILCAIYDRQEASTPVAPHSSNPVPA